MNTKEQLQKVQTASRTLVNLSEEKINAVLFDLAESVIDRADKILEANRKDLEKMDKSDPKYDRLELNHERLKGIASDMRSVVNLEYPVGKILEERVMENGLKLSKVSVPLGVIGIVYEARPNVTFDVFSLCLKSGNACVLKGGSDAENSNKEIVLLIHEVLEKNGIDKNVVYLAPVERDAVSEILSASEYIDVIIPRGGKNLIDFVRKNSTVPVIETGAGIVHTYFDESGDLEKGKAIILNAKTRRPSVCNALDTLIIHKNRLKDLSELVSALEERGVQIFADSDAYKALDGEYDKSLLSEAGEEHFGMEFLSLKMSIKTVEDCKAAVEHITKYSSKHSEAIIAEDKEAVEYFLQNVDASAVYANASTCFTDGAQFGLGSEIGISTQKLHARGPMGLKELTSYKWIVIGNGHIRL